MRFDKVIDFHGEELSFRCEACNDEMEVVMHNDGLHTVVLKCKGCTDLISSMEEEHDETKALLAEEEKHVELLKDAIKKAYYILEDAD